MKMSESINQSRRQFIKTAGIFSAAFLLPKFITHEMHGLEKPNIVFILADDQGVHELGCYGNPYYYSPNIDRLSREGMMFTNSYAACPVCSPTRASIMTGKYPARLHLSDFIPGKETQPEDYLTTPDWTKQLPLEEATIAEALKTSGYITGHFGKWHLNYDKNYSPGRPGDPGSQGFDVVFTSVKPNKNDNPDADAHHVKAITENALKFIESNKDRHFFCYMAHHSIHSPKMENEELIQKYKEKPGADLPKNSPVIGAMIETLDNNIGRVLDKLDELNLSHNTIVIYFADNGCSTAKEILKPLRGGKAQLYEGGIREPLIVRWPGVVKPGSKCDVPVTSVDFFPTILNICDVKNKNSNIDGVDILPLLEGGEKYSDRPIFWHYPHYHSQGIAPSGAVRKGRYKLIEWYEKSINGIETEGALELFDLEIDISEQKNLINEKPLLGRELYNELKNWRKKVNAQEMLLNPDYKPGSNKKKTVKDE
jgi:arylsulfatase A